MSKFALAAEEATRKAAAKRAEANALADKEGGLSKDEATRFDALITEAEAFDAEATENRTRAERQKANGEALSSHSRPRPRQAADPEGEPVVAREAWRDDPQCGFKSPFVGTAGRLEPEARLADAPTRSDALEAALRTAGVLKGA